MSLSSPFDAKRTKANVLYGLKLATWRFLSILVILIIANVVLSWVGRGSPTQYMLSEILNPLLAPIKRILPSMGPLDLSPLVLLIAIQIAQIVLSNISRSLVT